MKKERLMLLSKNDIENSRIDVIDSASARLDMKVEQIITEQVPISVEKDKVYPFWTDGKWSYHQLIKQLIEQVGKSNVLISTWAITEEPLRVLFRLKELGLIGSLKGLFDYRLGERSPKGYAFAQSFFDDIILIENHSKVTVIQNKTIPITVIGSANWTKNKRLEAGTILTDQTTCEQFYTLFERKINETYKKRN